MSHVKPFVLLLVLATVLAGIPSAPSPVEAAPLAPYRGVLEYQVNGPGAAPYGLGSSLLLGAAVPIAMARVQNILRNLFDVVSNLPEVRDAFAIDTVQRWMNEGIAIDLASELPITGSYDATVSFVLEEASDGSFELRSGWVRWRASNSFTYSEGNISMHDSYKSSGMHVLDPATDTISLRIDRKGGAATYELDMDISHPDPIDGSSTFSGPPGTFAITMEAVRGEMVMDGSALGIPIAAVGAPTPMIVVEAPGIDRSVRYARRGEVEGMHYHVETWRDAFDNQVFVEYELRTDCKAEILVPEPDAVLSFDDSDTGVLAFTVEARTNRAKLDAVLDDLVWTIPEIPDSVLTTDPEDARGKQVTVRYEGLPANNSGFGPKTIGASFALEGLCDDPEPATPRIFFSREASNHPGGGDEPNWFYYWMQTRAGQGHGDAVVYDGDIASAHGLYWGFTEPDKKDVIYIANLAPDFEYVNALTGRITEGIDAFGSLILHEWTHLENCHDWWPDGYHPPAGDADGDYVLDDREAAYGLDPGNRDTFGLGMRDSEVPAYLQDHTWPAGSANREDWAYPGKQSGGAE